MEIVSAKELLLAGDKDEVGADGFLSTTLVDELQAMCDGNRLPSCQEFSKAKQVQKCRRIIIISQIP